MISMVLIILLALFLVAMLAGLTYRRLKTSTYKFKDFEVTEIPYITMDIQGNLFNMVVDTGCAVSLLNVPSLKGCELLYKDINKAIDLSAVTSDKIEARGINIKFDIGKKEISEDFYLQNHEDFANFNKMHGITIHGLLGSSFFHNNNCRINYKNHQLEVL